MAFRHSIAVGCALVLACPVAGLAASTGDKNLETAGTGVAIALPIIAVGITYAHDRDWNGLGEFAISTGLTVGTALILKQIVKEPRPDHSDNQSFPSETTALSASSADYLWARYGWEYGLPASLASAFVGYSRVKAKKHHWYDVAASSVMAAGFNYAFVERYHGSNRYNVYAETDGDTVGVRFAMNW